MFIFGFKMEDVFTNYNNNYQFDFNSFWIANNSPTKRIAVRKIKNYKDSITCVVSFSINDPIQPPPNNIIFDLLNTVNDNNSIVDFSNYLTERINIRLDELFPDAHFRICISFFSNIVSFTSNIRRVVHGLNYDSIIQFKHECDV
jgi:hypothetical protein